MNNIIVEKSQQDERKYKVIELDNKLKVLIIKDKETDKSAACMSIKIGAICDPSNSQGIAHFLEHMLFMGTSSNPDPNDFSDFLQMNGSEVNNAETTLNQTKYYFDCGNESFEKALQYFSEFFLCPLFSKDQVEKEIKAVNSEFMSQINDDSCREERMMKILAKEGHPFRQFGNGSQESLNTIPNLQQRVKQFYEENYSANLMRLIVYSDKKLKEQERIIRNYYTKIKNFDKQVYEWPTKAFDATNLGQFIKMVPTKDQNKLGIAWILENFGTQYKTKPQFCLVQLLAHEGPNSLLSFLIDEGLALTLVAGDETEINEFSLITIEIVLTEKGFKNYKDILAYVFQYLKILRENGAQQWFYEEWQTIEKLKFEYKNKLNPIDYLESLAYKIHDVESEHFLSHAYLLTQFDKDFSDKILNNLQLANSIIFLSSKEFETIADKTESYFKIKYTSSPIPEEFFKMFEDNQVKPALTKKVLGYPCRNMFIPENFAIVEGSSSTNAPQIPSLILKTELSNLWQEISRIIIILQGTNQIVNSKQKQ